MVLAVRRLQRKEFVQQEDVGDANGEIR